MTDSQEVAPIPPAPRSLRTIRGARLELARLYQQTKVGQVRPEVAGKLCHMLNVMIASARDSEFADRLTELERRTAPAKPNGQYDARA